MSITDVISVLQGAKLVDMGRAANMAWLIFEKEGGVQYSLHVQCPWRFESNNEILIAQGDMYYPASTYSGDEDSFDCDIVGNNLYDEKVLIIKISIM